MTNDVVAVILAAGWGTRLLPATKAVPKEVFPLVDRPLIQYTLEEVVEFYSSGGQPNAYLSPAIRPLFLTGDEKAALVAFLRALAE